MTNNNIQKCPSCGYTIDAGEDFCGACGSPADLPPDDAAVKRSKEATIVEPRQKSSDRWGSPMDQTVAPDRWGSPDPVPPPPPQIAAYPPPQPANQWTPADPSSRPKRRWLRALLIISVILIGLVVLCGIAALIAFFFFPDIYVY
jgi:hypothetical protein